MGRQNQRGLELTWHGYSGRWRKRVDGVDHFFGSGKGVSDRASYKAALARYRAWQDSRELHQAKTILAKEAIDAYQRSAESPEGSPLSIPDLLAMVRGGKLEADVVRALFPILKAEVNDAEAAASGAGVSATPEGEKTEVDALLDEFTDALKARHEQTRKAPQTLTPRQRLGGHGLRNLTWSVETLREHLKTARLTAFNDAARIETALSSFRAGLDKRVSKAKLTGGSADVLLKAVKPFFQWAWEHHKISELPRNLRTITSKHQRTSTAKPLAVEDIRKLWAIADDRMRTFIALALNCGWYAIDISTFRAEHVTPDGRYIARFRQKTGAPSKHLLWPVTKALLARNRDDKKLRTRGLVFIRQRKSGLLPLVIEHPDRSGVYDSIARDFSLLAKRAGVVASWSRFRDTAAQFIEQVGRNGEGLSDPGLVSQFLGHSDSRMARFYLDQAPAKLDTTKLDKALDALDKLLALNIDVPTATAA